jgi:chromate transporter
LPTSLQSKIVHPGFSEAVRFWWKLGWISFGGTAAHIATLHDELVLNKGWIAEGEFLHALSHCMLLPGPEAQQLAIYIGWKLHGKKGGIAAGSLFVLPSMFVLLALSLLYVRFGRLAAVAAMISGLRPGIVALVALALLRVAKRTLVSPLQWGVALACFIAMVRLQTSLPLIMLGVMLLGVVVIWWRPQLLAVVPGAENGRSESSGLTWKRTFASLVRIALGGFVLWLAPLLCLYFLLPDFGFWKRLSLFFTQTAFVTIGGSYTVIPYVAHLAVIRYHWLNQSQMLDGFSLAETTPGPLIIVVAFVGFMAAFNHFHGSMLMGTVALMVTTFYTFLPCFVFVFAGAPLVDITQQTQSIQGILRLITAVVVAAMLNLALFLASGALFPAGQLNRKGLDQFAVVWMLISFVLLRRFKIGMAPFVGLCLLSGVVRWLL